MTREHESDLSSKMVADGLDTVCKMYFGREFPLVLFVADASDGIYNERPLHGGCPRTWGASAASAVKTVTEVPGLMLSLAEVRRWIWTPLSELYLVVLSNFRKDEK